ncbi:MAG: Rrf2 family transcriptional regulator [Gammaproteobacteria bacterium]|nr:Rrf2 family transcriptional regulator [Gammaproteobacteria bacterium]
MQLTLYTDYSLRVLLYLGIHKNEKATINEIADYFKISRNHLVKVVHNLAVCGYIHTVRGKGGGMSLARPAEEINIGDVVRHTEPNFHVVECFNPQTTHCPAYNVCTLIDVLNSALTNFFAILDRYTLADLLKKPGMISKPLQFVPMQARPAPAAGRKHPSRRKTTARRLSV